MTRQDFERGADINFKTDNSKEKQGVRYLVGEKKEKEREKEKQGVRYLVGEKEKEREKKKEKKRD